KGQSAADDRVAAVEARLRVEDVHRSAAPPGTSFGLAVHLRHQCAGRYAARERMAVLAIGREDGVLRRECPHRASGHCLLADVEMQETANLARTVEFRALLLEAPDAHHLLEQSDVEPAAVGHAPPSSVE